MMRSVLSHPREKERLLSYFETQVMQVLNWLATYSPDEEGGITRLLYTEGWLETQQALALKMESCGLTTEFDNVGNLFGKLQGDDRDAPSIITGSHIDTVIQGGHYDGAYGIAAGLLALDYLQKQFGKPKRTLELVSLCEEEGSRFPMAYWGSGSIAGKRNFEQIVHLQDAQDVFLRMRCSNAALAKERAGIAADMILARLLRSISSKGRCWSRMASLSV